RHTAVPGAPAIPTSMHEDPRARLITHVIAMGAAERYDILLRPEVAGEYTMTIEWFHWITGRMLARRSVPLIAS
ncbi:MAG: copper oxidase, partial [Arthrobacter sp.]